MMRERGVVPNIPPYEHDRKSYYIVDGQSGHKFRPLDLIHGGYLVALSADLVRKREHFRAGITTFPPGEPPKRQDVLHRTKELTHVA